MKNITQKSFCIPHSAFCIVVAAAASAAAATTYVVPWYANPTAVATVYNASTVSAFDPAVAPLSTAWATVANDANVAGQTIVAKRMSHSDYFRPRLYALRADGTIVIYTLTKTLDEIKWTTVYSSADLIARVNHNGGSLATGQTVTAFEVVDKDGETAFVQFDNSGTWQALANSHPTWTYYAANANGNPSPGGSDNCISDGRWILKCSLSNGNITIGDWGEQVQPAMLNAYRGEFLDFTTGVAVNGNSRPNLYEFPYCAIRDSARVILHSTKYKNSPSNAGVKKLNPEELVLQSTAMNTMTAWASCMQLRQVLDLPNLTTAGNYSFSDNKNAYGEETDFADFNLPKLETIGDGAWEYNKGRGVLTLPSVKTMGILAFYGCDNMEEAILSAEKKSLKSITDSTFAAVGTRGSLRRVTLGCAEGFTNAAANAFSKQPLEVVTFTGAVPAFKKATAWPDTASNTMVFAIPEGVAAWDAIAASATPLTEAQRKACHAAHPDWPIPFGVVASSVFHSNYDQYLAHIGDDRGVSLTIERDTFFDDTITVSADWTPFADGTYPRGTVATLSATPNANGTFVKWYGNVARDEETNPSITVTLDSDKWLYARIVHPWTLAADKTTMSNGNFTVNCSVVNESARTLQVGIDWRSQVGGIYANDDGSGVLDLGGPVTLAGEGSQWTVVRMASGDAAWVAPASAKVDVFITPSTLTTAYANTATAALNAYGAGAYATVILDEPNASWAWTRKWYCAQDYRLRHLVLRLPKLTAMSAQYSFSGCSELTATKLDWWDLGGLRSIGSDSWKIGSSASVSRLPASGTLSLPSFRSVVGEELQRMANVECFVFGGKTAVTTITNIAANAFAYGTSLKRLVLHAGPDLVVGATPFANGRTPDEIVFSGPPPQSETSFANLLAGVSAGDSPVIVRFPKVKQSWLDAAYIDRSFSAAERALAGDEAKKVFGVYRGESDGTPFVKAVCIPDEMPKGMVIIVK